METLNQLISSIESNPLIVTLVSGGIIVTIFRYIKDILVWLKNIIINLISFKITTRYATEYEIPEVFRKFLKLVNDDSKILWAKTLEVSKSHSAWYNNDINLLPHGSSLRIMYGSLIYMTKEYETESLKVTVDITLRVFFCKKQKFIDNLIKHSKEVSFRNSNNILITTELEGWVLDVEKSKRYQNSIYTNNNIISFLINDIKKFISNEPLYEQCSIPYKRNYLFYGKAGCGKTSAVSVLASELDYDIQIFDAGSQKPPEIIKTMIASSAKTIFLFEDIDAITKNIKDRDDESKEDKRVTIESESEMTLGQLLNITDGLVTKHGSICIFTTNHIDKLDKAFLRDGRMDVKIEFEYFNKETSNKMIQDKLGFTIKNIKDNICPSSLQESILQVLLGNKSRKEFENEWTKSE